MGTTHTGNVQPTIDKEEHEHSLEPATKRVLAYGYDGSAKQIIKVNSQGELVVNTGGGEEALRMDDVTTTSVTYVGKAAIGTATSAALWQVKKIDESGTPQTLVITWADGDDSYNNVWDNRASLSYS